MDRRGVEEGVQVVAHLTERGRIRLWVDLRRGRRPAWLRVVSDDGTEVDRRSRAELETDTDQPHEEDPFAAPFAGLHWWDLAELAAGTSYRVEDDRETPLATFRTLPDRLPLTVVVGSCYSVDDDDLHPSGQVPAAPQRLQRLRRLRRWGAALRSATFPVRRDEDDAGGVAPRYEALARHLARVGRPIDLTLLLGDQVYVDQPPWDYLKPLDAGGSWDLVAKRYRGTWRRLGPLLSGGTNICVSEDHEYWNNYPDPPLWLWRWDDAGLEGLRRAADRHRAVYQQTPPATSLRIGVEPSVQLFVADTRKGRTVARTDGSRFMDRDEFTDLIAWLDGLDGPGVLVVGQPLLAAKGNPRKDTTLANYPEQHVPLCEAISRAEHDVVVVCGDVHYGRYSVVPLASGRHLVEVVSSPMALLASAGSAPVVAEAPAALAVEGHVCSRFLRHTRPDGVGEDHITVLRFSATEDGVALEVTPYYTRFADADGAPREAASWTPVVLR